MITMTKFKTFEVLVRSSIFGSAFDIMLYLKIDKLAQNVDTSSLLLFRFFHQGAQFQIHNGTLETFI